MHLVISEGSICPSLLLSVVTLKVILEGKGTLITVKLNYQIPINDKVLWKTL